MFSRWRDTWFLQIVQVAGLFNTLLLNRPSFSADPSASERLILPDPWILVTFPKIVRSIRLAPCFWLHYQPVFKVETSAVIRRISRFRWPWNLGAIRHTEHRLAGTPNDYLVWFRGIAAV